jgi:lysophospholipase L1-like esterase
VRLLRCLTVLAAALPLAVLPAASGQAAPPSPAVYLALGDSVAFGTGATDPATQGYVPLLAADLQGDGCGKGKGKAVGCRVELVNLAENGATTVTLDRQAAATCARPDRGAQRDPYERRRRPAHHDHDRRQRRRRPGGPGLRARSRELPGDDRRAGGAGVHELRPHPQRAARGCRSGHHHRCHRLLQRHREHRLRHQRRHSPRPGRPRGQPPRARWRARARPAPVAAGFNDAIRQQAAAYGAVIVETAAVVDPQTETQPDCLHPNTKGHADIAAAVADAVGNPFHGRGGKKR